MRHQPTRDTRCGAFGPALCSSTHLVHLYDAFSSYFCVLGTHVCMDMPARLCTYVWRPEGNLRWHSSAGTVHLTVSSGALRGAWALLSSEPQTHPRPHTVRPAGTAPRPAFQLCAGAQRPLLPRLPPCVPIPDFIYSCNLLILLLKSCRHEVYMSQNIPNTALQFN